ncbi:MAG: hypothetical protein U1B83_08790 [Candidatus Cloacimonadaceae bacterium]|nr:hypothetical protein [Candidatus Cloacimonadaceae bacterium]
MALLILLLLLPLSAFSQVEEEPKEGDGGFVTGKQTDRTEAFYDSLKAGSERNWVWRTLYPMVFSEDSTEVELREQDGTFRSWQGKTIRSIQIRVHKAFTPDSSKGKRSIHNLVAYFGNGIHIKTRDWVIQENLFFHEGDRLEPETMLHNLKYLRKLSYLDEVRFVVKNSSDAADSIDIIVDIKDKFSINLGGGVISRTQMNLKINDQNFLGLGRLLLTEWHLDTEQRGSLGHKLYYKIPNFRGSFVDTELGWAELPGYSWKSMAINRPFLFPVTRAAGGTDISKTWVSAPFDSTEVDDVRLGGWYGHSFAARPGSAHQYAYAALSLDQIWYRRRPDVGADFGKYWHESLMATGAIGITESDYGYLPYIYTLLEDNDIPVGFLYEFLFGKELGEFRNREFLGLRGAWGKIVHNGAFLHLKGGIETFFSPTGTEQGAITFEPLYITPLQSLGRFRGRAFFRGRMILGSDRFPPESVALSTDPYFRGNRDISGTTLIALGVEEDVILPWNVFGFHLSIFGFMDVALVTDKLWVTGNENRLYTEALGIRFRNPHLLWDSIELHGEWNQGAGEDKSFNIVLSTKVPIKMLDFEGIRPRPYVFH